MSCSGHRCHSLADRCVASIDSRFQPGGIASRMRRLVARTALLAAASSVGCIGNIGDGPGGASDTPNGPAGGGSAPASVAEVPASALRRLTREELGRVLFDLLGLDVTPVLQLLPVDEETPFDNDYRTQLAGPALIEGVHALAEQVSESVLADPAARDALVGCVPSGADDTACLADFVARFGRRALRRPLEPDEIDQYTALSSFAVEAGDFYVAVDLVLRAMFQDLEFLYRVEIGEPALDLPGAFALGDFEVASRLSFLLWGSTPDDELLDAAEAGTLGSGDGVRDQAIRLLADERAVDQVLRLHAMWLDYDDFQGPPAIDVSLTTETEALLQRIIFEERRPWTELFTSTETFVDDALAQHYGLPGPGASPGWVTYPKGGRAGLLSHGTFLSVGSRFGDTSPVFRGKNVLQRLLCRSIPPPPPSVDSGLPPPAKSPDDCKIDRYDMSTQADCSGCHKLMDPIGFGLENYGPNGQWRDTDIDRPDCPIDGAGAIDGLGSFNGPGELGALLVESGELEACFVRQFYQFAIGRPVAKSEQAALDELAQVFAEKPDFLELVLAFVANDAFRYRVIDEES